MSSKVINVVVGMMEPPEIVELALSVVVASVIAVFCGLYTGTAVTVAEGTPVASKLRAVTDDTAGLPLGNRAPAFNSR